jgi:hypothetical protein
MPLSFPGQSLSSQKAGQVTAISVEVRAFFVSVFAA